MGKVLKEKLWKVEKRAYKIIGGKPNVDLMTFMDQQAKRTIAAASNPDHRLHNIFLINSRKNTLVAPMCKTSRRRDSILKYV